MSTAQSAGVCRTPGTDRQLVATPAVRSCDAASPLDPGLSWRLVGIWKAGGIQLADVHQPIATRLATGPGVDDQFGREQYCLAICRPVKGGPTHAQSQAAFASLPNAPLGSAGAWTGATPSGSCRGGRGRGGGRRGGRSRRLGDRPSGGRSSGRAAPEDRGARSDPLARPSASCRRAADNDPTLIRLPDRRDCPVRAAGPQADRIAGPGAHGQHNRVRGAATGMHPHNRHGQGAAAEPASTKRSGSGSDWTTRPPCVLIQAWLAGLRRGEPAGGARPGAEDGDGRCPRSHTGWRRRGRLIGRERAELEGFGRGLDLKLIVAKRRSRLSCGMRCPCLGSRLILRRGG